MWSYFIEFASEKKENIHSFLVNLLKFKFVSLFGDFLPNVSLLFLTTLIVVSFFLSKIVSQAFSPTLSLPSGFFFSFYHWCIISNK